MCAKSLSGEWQVKHLPGPLKCDAVGRARLAEAAKEQEERRFRRALPWRVSSAYYTVEDEHDIEVVEHLVGAAFVLGQAAITQAISILKRMHEEGGKPSWIPSDKVKIMEAAAPVHADTGLSKITIINAVADSYKHRYEWKDEEWSGPDIKNKTIRIAAAIGPGPKGYHNLEHALRTRNILAQYGSPRPACCDVAGKPRRLHPSGREEERRLYRAQIPAKRRSRTRRLNSVTPMILISL
jgi:hypothetical protein